MKNLLVILVFIFIFGGFASAQNPPVAPDYTQWEKQEGERVEASFNGKEIIVQIEHYSYHTGNKIGQHAFIILDEEDKPWFFINMVEQSTIGYVYIFERKDNLWVFIQGVQSEEEFMKYLKDNYKLEFK